MRSLIYFPGFEPSHVDWLKFALLYLDKVRPIVPESADAQLSDTFRDVLRFTDLIELYRPAYREGELATADAIEQVERILGRPQLFAAIFGTDRVDQLWRRAHADDMELWNEKFSHNWQSFCRENGFGRASAHGMLIPKSLAGVYMTILANCIADGHGFPPISDDASISEFSFFVRRREIAGDGAEAAVLQTSLPIVLPENLSEIDLNAVMRLRHSRRFEEKRHALQEVVQKVATAVEDGREDADLKKDLGNVFQDFSDDVARLGTGLASLAFGIWMVTNGPSFGSMEATRQALVGTAFTVGGVIALRRTWNNTRVKRLARRYLLDIDRLHRETGKGVGDG